MPESERPREKLKENSAEYLTDTELLSIILRTGTKGVNVKQLSGKILSEHSFHGLLNVSREELEKFDGVSKVKSGQLKAVAEIANRMQRENRSEVESLEDLKSETADMRLLDTEKLRVFFLNSGNEVIDVDTFDGGVSSVSIELKQILGSAVSKNAAAVILAHNHPSGKAEPTEADRRFTQELGRSAEILDVDLLDHVIIGKELFSFRRDSELIDL